MTNANETSPASDDLPVEVEMVEMRLVPVTEWEPAESPVYHGATPGLLHYDRGCECGVYYGNQITVPKRHSVICFCPKCGCVTVD